MTYKKEVIRWANSPDGTRVWEYFPIPNKQWIRITHGMFLSPNTKYIVDDEWAYLRMAQEDGKQLQLYSGTDGRGMPVWKDNTLSDMFECASVSVPDDWRIKPEPETEEWQWVMKDLTRGEFFITTSYFKDAEEISLTGNYETVEKYEKSRRVRNET